VGGEPLEHILGWAEFAGLRIAVDPGVFVPRRRTELLVAEAVDAATAALGYRDRLAVGAGVRAPDVAPGLRHRPAVVELHAADLDPAAVRCARRNLAGVAAVHEGDLFAALPPRLRGVVHVLTASPPYVPTRALRLMPREARDHEPQEALDGGADGLDVVRRLVAGAPGWLRPGGQLLLDLGLEQAPAASAILRYAGLRVQVRHEDDLGGTVVSGVMGRPR